jgi:thioredoxin reductase (NADPH)
MDLQDFDLVVVGAGLAGLTAAMFGSRYGLRTAVVDQMGAGGQIVNAELIENFPGFPLGIAGYDLGPLVQEQAENAGCEFLFDIIRGLTPTAGGHVLLGDEEELQARAVIIAAGSTMRSLGIPGETELFGKGVSHCASCDGAFFSGGHVAVVGGGDAALDEALVLAKHAATVTVFHRGPALRAQKAIVDRAAALPNIEVVYNTVVEEVLGRDAVTGVRLRDIAAGTTRQQELGGVFVYVGLEPNSAFLQGVVDLDSSGHIVTDILLRTSAEGIFAAGDIRQHSVALLAAVAGDGATAAAAAYRYLKGTA